MCAVSMVSEFYKDDNFKFQQYQPIQPMPWPQTVPQTLPWSPDAFKLLQEIMEKMKQLDDRLGLADCEDPKKAEWMKDIEKRLKNVEKRKKQSQRVR